MSFQIKDFASIVAAQINHARAVTTKISDFQSGSVFRTLMEAPAVEVEELYMQMFLGLRDAIPIATFLSFNFDLIPAATAIGYVSVSASTPPSQQLVIPAGTAFNAVDGRVYTSVGDVIWSAGLSDMRVQVAFTEAGSVGNIAQGVITSSSFFSTGYTISNSTIDSGRDVETDSERETRFAEFVKSLSRGTVAACLYATKNAPVYDAYNNIYEYVVRQGLSEVPGRVSIYLYSNRGIPSADLLSNAQAVIDGAVDNLTGTATPGYRAAGIRVDVLPMTELVVPLGIKVQMLDGYQLTPAVKQTIGDLFASVIMGVPSGTVLQLDALIEQLLTAPGVKSIVPTTTTNIVCDVNEVLTPGVLTIDPL